MYHQFKEELRSRHNKTTTMEVGPTAHCVMGGVRVDPESQESTVQVFMLRGESATGLRGANRLGGNSLSDLVTFGRRAGLYASRAASSMDSWGQIEEEEIQKGIGHMMAPLEREEGENPASIVHDLREMMQEKGRDNQNSRSVA